MGLFMDSLEPSPLRLHISGCESRGFPGCGFDERPFWLEGRRIKALVALGHRSVVWAVATAVSQWVFDIPGRKRHPTAVRASPPFESKSQKQ
jgi:hypothetical protein